MRRRFPPSLFLALLAILVLIYVIAEAPWRGDEAKEEAAPAAPIKAPAAPAARPAAEPAKPAPEKGPRAAAAAIIVDDLGFNVAASRRLADLGFPVTVALFAYAPHTEETLRVVREAGLEVILHLPLEAYGGGDPSVMNEGLVTSGMSDEGIRRVVEASLDRLPGCLGVNNHEGSLATADAAIMRSVLAVLKERRLYFIDSRTTPGTLAFEEARALGVPAASRRVFLDDVQSVEAVRARLKELFRRARRDGKAAAIGHPKEATLEALEGAAVLAARYGVRLVFASAIVD